MRYEKTNLPTTAIALLIATLLLALAWPKPGRAQETMSEEALRARVAEVLPKWDATLLRVPAGKDWSSDLDFNAVYRVVGVRPPATERIPKGARQLATETAIVRLDAERGGVRFVDRSRAWSFDKGRDAKLPPDEAASQRTLATVFELGLPREELGSVRVDTQIGAGARAGSKQLEDRFEMYRIVTGERKIAGLPVFGSRLRSAVNSEGQVQRLMVEWPRFRMETGLELVDRERVIAQAVREIASQDPSTKAEIRAELAWAPVGDDEEVYYAPSVVFSVLDPPTPYQFTVPVAAPGSYKGTERESSRQAP